jgi:serine/threonine-protein phosphatase 4 regulatory subunit 2
LIASGKKQVVGYFFSLEINFLLFRHDWSFLKRLLSLQLKQVLAEYSEGQVVSQEDGQLQNSFSGETYSELVIWLNDALLRFEEGPPFTLQRLCEVMNNLFKNSL